MEAFGVEHHSAALERSFATVGNEIPGLPDPEIDNAFKTVFVVQARPPWVETDSVLFGDGNCHPRMGLHSFLCHHPESQYLSSPIQTLPREGARLSDKSFSRALATRPPHQHATCWKQMLAL